MAKKETPPAKPLPPVEPQIFAASLGPNGAVIKGAAITQAEAVVLRKKGDNVVVCGPNLAANKSLAKTIEANANGRWIPHRPHASAGRNALPHVQPDPGPPGGHTFYETPNRKAKWGLNEIFYA
jgi:hypothetical protein